MKENIEIFWKTKIYLTPSASNETRQEILLQNIINNKIFIPLLFQKKYAQIVTLLGSLSGLRSNVIRHKRHLGPALTALPALVSTLHIAPAQLSSALGCLAIRQCPCCSMHIFCHVIPPTSQLERSRESHCESIKTYSSASNLEKISVSIHKILSAVFPLINMSVNA